DFNGFQLNTLQYQQFQVGIAGSDFGIALSVYNGAQYEMLHAPTAQMYTSTAGDYIDFTTNYSMVRSDPAHTQTLSNNGIGAGLDLYYHLNIACNKEVYVECSDIGFIRWNPKTNHYGNDTAYHFDGFAIQNAFQLGDTTVHYSAKSVLNARVNEQKGYTSYLPGMINVCYVTDGHIYQIIPGIRFRYNANYRPCEYVQFLYHIRKKLLINLELAYGGYAGLQSGLSVHALLGKGITLKAGTSNFMGYLVPAFTCGQGAYISLSKTFR
ncbi:MAG TPA: DUF5723 family protein, partial [Bacteroidia bacterium]|nr:DUF5723 family protein [Bacteroidia bacterium]